MTPGGFLRAARESKGWTLDDVALRTETVPPVSARARADWLAGIEADVQPLAVITAIRLHALYRFDWGELLAVAAAHADLAPPAIDPAAQVDAVHAAAKAAA